MPKTWAINNFIWLNFITAKRHANGKGNTGNAEVIAAMKALGHPVTDDNEADTLALLHWALAQGMDLALGKPVRHG